MITVGEHRLSTTRSSRSKGEVWSFILVALLFSLYKGNLLHISLFFPILTPRFLTKCWLWPFPANRMRWSLRSRRKTTKRRISRAKIITFWWSSYRPFGTWYSRTPTSSATQWSSWIKWVECSQTDQSLIDYLPDQHGEHIVIAAATDGLALGNIDIPATVEDLLGHVDSLHASSCADQMRLSVRSLVLEPADDPR